MKLSELKELMRQWSVGYEQIYRSSPSSFSVLHEQACKEFLANQISYHHFYCDMKRFESLDFDEIALVMYDPISGQTTQVIAVKSHTEVERLFIMLHTEFIEGALLMFEKTGQETFNYQPLPVSCGRVYKLSSNLLP